LGAKTRLVGSVERRRASWFSDIDLAVDSADEEKVAGVEQELKNKSRFRFHFWPKH